MAKKQSKAKQLLGESVAAINEKVGMGFEILISFLLPLLSGWLKGCGGQPASEAVSLNYDEATDSFDQDFVEAGRRRASVAAKKAWRQDRTLQRRPPDEKLDEITVATYRRVMEIGDRDVKTCMSAMQS